jgi:predicted amidohydrolase/ribosomal protein S18 acetylase RimI-like enzyme
MANDAANRATGHMGEARTAEAQMSETKPKLILRTAQLKDLPAIETLGRVCYPDAPPYTLAQLRGHIQNFPEGQFVAVYDDEIVGYAASFMIAEALAMAPHDWAAITGSGYASRHDPAGDVLYGMEVMVDPAYRGLRIGQRLYAARRRLAAAYNLKAIAFAGRMPGLRRHVKRGDVASPEQYLERVKTRALRDSVLSFQMRNGFEPVGVLRSYDPTDKDSMGHAALLVWRNPKHVAEPKPGVKLAPRAEPAALPDKVRIACVQYQQRRVASFEEFGRNVEYFVDVVADYKSDFVVFPELFTLQLLSIENRHVPADQAIAALTQYTQPLKDLMSRLAVQYNVNIIGGSHPTRDEDGNIVNVCFVCLRDGSIERQEKIHPTPNERFWWSITGGREAKTIVTDCGPIGVMICYDAEFPEVSRHLVDQGAQILFVPFCTDERKSYLRVRYCCQARAVENQVYVALAGNVGNLPNVENMDIQYAQSCILAPCDFPFDRDGIAADTTPNVEMVAVADLNLQDLRGARIGGTVQNLRDRRFDLYQVRWRGD